MFNFCSRHVSRKYFNNEDFPVYGDHIGTINAAQISHALASEVVDSLVAVSSASYWYE